LWNSASKIALYHRDTEIIKYIEPVSWAAFFCYILEEAIKAGVAAALSFFIEILISKSIDLAEFLRDVVEQLRAIIQETVNRNELENTIARLWVAQQSLVVYHGDPKKTKKDSGRLGMNLCTA
jgi:hypothetical protein